MVPSIIRLAILVFSFDKLKATRFPETVATDNLISFF